MSVAQLEITTGLGSTIGSTRFTGIRIKVFFLAQEGRDRF